MYLLSFILFILPQKSAMSKTKVTLLFSLIFCKRDVFTLFYTCYLTSRHRQWKWATSKTKVTFLLSLVLCRRDIFTLFYTHYLTSDTVMKISNVNDALDLDEILKVGKIETDKMTQRLKDMAAGMIGSVCCSECCSVCWGVCCGVCCIRQRNNATPQGCGGRCAGQ